MAIESGPAAVAKVLEETDGRGADVVIECTGVMTSIAEAIRMVRFGGRILLFGITNATSGALPFYDLYFKELTLINSRAATAQDFPVMIDLVDRGARSPGAAGNASHGAGRTRSSPRNGGGRRRAAAEDYSGSYMNDGQIMRHRPLFALAGARSSANGSNIQPLVCPKHRADCRIWARPRLEPPMASRIFRESGKSKTPKRVRPMDAPICRFPRIPQHRSAASRRPALSAVGGGLGQDSECPTTERTIRVTHCQPAGAIRLFTYPQYRKMVQIPGLLVILSERDVTFRQIFTDGRELPKDPQPSFTGYSSGHWDGDTLVVQTIGFRDGMWLDRSGSPMTSAAKMTERFRRVNYGNLEIEITMDDPKPIRRPGR